MSHDFENNELYYDETYVVMSTWHKRYENVYLYSYYNIKKKVMFGS